MRSDCVVFRKTKELFGGLSNMAAGFSLKVNKTYIPTSEALYQACRFPHRPEIQQLIVQQASPMTAKMKSKPHRNDSRPDWDVVRIKIMRWCLRVKLAQNWDEFGKLLRATGDRAIVEESRKDDFWGAKTVDDKTLVGGNVLGRLLMELREELKGVNSESLKQVLPLDIPDFRFFGEPVGIVADKYAKMKPKAFAEPKVCVESVDLFGTSHTASEVHDKLSGPSVEQNIKNETSEKIQGGKPSDIRKKTNNIMTYKKKLIEVALPLETINVASALEKQPFTRRHPRSIHIWWARRPLAAARAVIFAQMVDDPSAHPDLFPTEKAQDKERKRLFKIIEALVKWENTTNEKVMQQARDEIWTSWRRTCAENADHPKAKELFDRYKLPAFHDPFAGGGALPLEAQRLGLEAYASDLNPVAVLICKAMIEIPPMFAGKPPVNPEWQSKTPEEKAMRTWSGAQGLAEDVRYYGKWMSDNAEKRISHLYPKIEVTKEMLQERPDLKKYLGQKLKVIAWLWARTVKSPNPAFAHVDVPLVSTFMLSTKAGKEAYIEPVIENDGYRFTVKVGKPKDAQATKNGTKVGRGGHFICLMSGSPIPVTYIREQGIAGTFGKRMMAIVAEVPNGRVYLAPDPVSEKAAQDAMPSWIPEQEINHNPRDIRTQLYGLMHYGDIFTPRQLVALTTFSDMVQESRELLIHDALAAGLPGDGKTLDAGNGVIRYADAVMVYLGLSISRWSDLSNSLCSWNSTNQNVRALFARQAIPMTWDFVELSPFSKVGSWFSTIKSSVEATVSLAPKQFGSAIQADAATQTISKDKCISTDPPYYDNIGYADLSDFFYVWLRRSLKPICPDLFATLAVPKAEELVATPYRHGSKEKAEVFFLKGMTQAMNRIAEMAHPVLPVTIYYAFKQSESNGAYGTASTAWEIFLEAVIRAGFAISGTWPMRTEREARSVGLGTNALASSIILVCRKCNDNVQTITRRDLISALKAELPEALVHLQRGNIAPVDLAQAAIGPGMAVFTRYSKVLDAEGKSLTVRDALSLINQILDETLTEQEGDFDADSRWALAWFEQFGFNEGEYGVAEILSKAKNTSVEGLVDAGFLNSKSGKVRIMKPCELPADWDPEKDKRLTTWEMVHHLIRVLESGGEAEAAKIVAKLGSKAETARELCYRLYTLCERKKRAAEALSYNALVQSWPEISRLASDSHEIEESQKSQSELFEND